MKNLIALLLLVFSSVCFAQTSQSQTQQSAFIGLSNSFNLSKDAKGKLLEFSMPKFDASNFSPSNKKAVIVKDSFLIRQTITPIKADASRDTTTGALIETVYYKVETAFIAEPIEKGAVKKFRDSAKKEVEKILSEDDLH